MGWGRAVCKWIVCCWPRLSHKAELICLSSECNSERPHYNRDTDDQCHSCKGDKQDYKDDVGPAKQTYRDHASHKVAEIAKVGKILAGNCPILSKTQPYLAEQPVCFASGFQRARSSVPVGVAASLNRRH